MAVRARESFDIAVVGAGPAGLLAACLLARCGARVAAIGPDTRSAPDERTTALFMGAIRLLEKTGVWPRLSGAAAPLAVMRIVDRLDRADHPSVVFFEARELGPDPFGFNIANTALVAALEDCAASERGVSRIIDTVCAFGHDDDGVSLAVSTGSTCRAQLVVAADGRGSPARAAAGIEARIWNYGQSALVTTIAHGKPHNGVSTEVHRPGGPFTTVPLPGERSAALWLDSPAGIETLMGCDDTALARRMEDELDGFLGSVVLDGPRAVFPIRGLSVGAVAARRTALVGEAAHVVAPIGAQGLNLGFRDVASLAGLVRDTIAHGTDPGAPGLLEAYSRSRWRDVATRQAACDLLNRSLLIDFAAIRGARGVGLALLAGLGPLRRRLMREGMVRDRDLPELMRS